MKTYKWFFLILIASVFVACGGDSEDELVGDWRRRAPIPDAGRTGAACFVIGDKGYICGGAINTSAVQRKRKEVYVFDHASGDGRGSWRTLKPFPGAARQQAVGFSLTVDGKGYGYMGTGWDGDEVSMNDFWRYDPGTDTWDSIAPLPAVERRGAIAFSLTVNGKEYGYVGTGYTGYPDGNYLIDFWQFDPAATTANESGGNPLHGKWTQVNGYSGFKKGGAVVFVIDNKAYIATGINTSGNTTTDFMMFDPNSSDAARVWTYKRAINNSDQDEDYDDDYGTLARSYGVAFTIPVSGETHGHIALGSSNHTVWEYDHVNDLWTERTSFYNNSMRQARANSIAFSFPQTGRAFVGLGLYGTSAYMDDMWEFFPLIEDYTYNDGQ
jgi:hypothetical protein